MTDVARAAALLGAGIGADGRRARKPLFWGCATAIVEAVKGHRCGGDNSSQRLGLPMNPGRSSTPVEPEISLSASTIIGALFESVSSSSAGNHGGDAAPQNAQARVFKIRGADSAGQRSSANVLIRRRYAWRGYDAATLAPTQMSDRVTLTATDCNVTVGTITVGLDGSEQLQAEETFADEIAELRRAGRRICEFTKLAVDTESASKRVLASLFHVAYLLAHRIRGCDTLVIEVNPRHVGYYRRLLGCFVLGAERDNRRVNAAAVLLSLDFHHAREQITLMAGRPEFMAGNQRTLYPFFFSAAEEQGIIARMQREPW